MWLVYVYEGQNKQQKGNQMAKKQIQINDIIFEKIKFRYHFLTESRMGYRNARPKALVDSFYPAWIARKIINEQDDGRDITTGEGYAISERVAQDLNSKKLHISELITMLGYTKTDIGKILQAAKNKEVNLVLVGLGGTGSNMLNWTYEMSQWVGKERIFNRLKLFDDDEFDIPNMLRIPFIPQFSTESLNAKKTNTIPKKFQLIATRTELFSHRLNQEWISDRTAQTLGLYRETIIYGAPDIGTREFLTSLPYTFMAATHRDNEYSIVENPSVDNDLMMETYGKINLTMFFLNHLSMTIDFLKHIGQRTTPYGLQENGTQVENETIVRNDFGEAFKAELAGGFKAGAKKLYVANEERSVIEINLPQEEA